MTFYELEKKCKKKKLLKILFILILISIFAILCLVYFLEFAYATKKIKKSIGIKKPIEIKKMKKRTEIQQKEITISPSIDLNITQSQNTSKTAVKIIKKIKNSFEQNKTTKSINKKVILQSSNLPSYKTCISIALKYLKQKDYQNALKWAKFANIQNKKDSLSWIISAKALYLSGKKLEAIKLLKIYNSYYNNKKIEKLIKEWSDK